MRALTVLSLVLAIGLCLPACDDDWALVAEELERTVDEVGDALAALDPCAPDGCCDGDATPDGEVERLAAEVGAWAEGVGEGVGRRAAGLETCLEESGRAWARRLEVALAELGRGADELAREADGAAREVERGLEGLQHELERSAEDVGEAVEHAVEQLGRHVEELGRELEGLASDVERWWRSAG